MNLPTHNRGTKLRKGDVGASIKSTDQYDGKLIYLIADDELLVTDLFITLEYAGFCVRKFSGFNDFKASCDEEVPVAIIMDVVFSDGEMDAGVASLIQGPCPPVIFVSGCDDIEARFAAVRAGASRYLSKPLDMKKLIHTLDGLTAPMVENPFRVLLIDDEALLKTYTSVLREAGLVVKTLSNSLECLNVLDEFKPDISVIDLYMPECSGSELVQLIRLNDAWALMPIIFLSEEPALDSQLVAMQLGGDDFLIKPIVSKRMVATIVAMAKRARRVTDLIKI